jgi:hypothetical protein
MLNHFKAGGGEAEAAGYMVGEAGLMFARAYGMCAGGGHHHLCTYTEYFIPLNNDVPL